MTEIKTNNGCYRCLDRRPGCHNGCERYLAWKAAAAAEKEKIRAAKRERKDADSYQLAAAARLRKMK